LPMPSQIPHTLFDIISLGVDAVLCHDQETCKTAHTCARSKMPQDNIVIFPRLVSRQQYVHRQETIDTNVPLPDEGVNIGR